MLGRETAPQRPRMTRIPRMVGSPASSLDSAGRLPACRGRLEAALPVFVIRASGLLRSAQLRLA
jgi:hypothetical protein